MLTGSCLFLHTGVAEIFSSLIFVLIFFSLKVVMVHLLDDRRGSDGGFSVTIMN